MRALIALAVLSTVACGGDSTGPKALSVGVYDYTAAVPFTRSDGSVGSTSYSGTLTLTYATADSIAGTFQVPGYRTDTALGFKNADAFVLYGYTTGGSTLAHRIRPDMGCTVKYVGPDPTGPCTLNLR